MRYHFNMKAKHKKTLVIIFTDPVNGNIEWDKIEALFIAIGCQVIEGTGSNVTFEKKWHSGIFPQTTSS